MESVTKDLAENKFKVKTSKIVVSKKIVKEAVMLCVGPSTAEKVDKVTGKLKLL
jgi:hypothetical protein